MRNYPIPRQGHSAELSRSPRDGEQTCLERSRKSQTILAVAVIILLATAVVEAKYSGGTGEPNNPYRIATAEDLNNIGNYEEDWDKHFVLVNDVNVAQYTGTQFKIIGRWIWWNDPNNKPFAGVFDGNEHKVWNFTWVSDNRDGVGIFGYLGRTGQIKNLRMENIDVNAINGRDVGGLVGHKEGMITNCHSIGNVSGEDGVGGLVGSNSGTISGCYFTGSTSGKAGVGGLAGDNYGTITDCYSTGGVSGKEDCVGGLVGTLDGEIINCYSSSSVKGRNDVGGLSGDSIYGRIKVCYSTGSVTGKSCVGGIVGISGKGVIIDCYSIGNVSGNYSVGGLVGFNGGTVTASFWDMQTSGQLTSGGGIGKTTAEMKRRSTFTGAGWDFIEIWGIGEDQTYPFLLTDPAGDSNHDRKVDFADLAILALHWLEER
jgi:hypothetical protein